MAPDLPSVGVVTITYNECANLVRTVESVLGLNYPDLRYWIIDGASSDGTRSFLESLSDPRVVWVSEPDRGLWHAMNKGLERATSDYLIFMNSGDCIHPSFNPVRLMQRVNDRRHAVIGYCVKSRGDLHFIQPGFSRESSVFTGPAHQAIFYPREYYENHRYLTNKKINADGYYSLDAVATCGAEFIPEVISMFSLGGRSTSYAGFRSLRNHIADNPSARKIVQTGIKWVAWHLLPRRAFYWLLFSYKWTRLRDPYAFSLPDRQLVREPVARAARAVGGNARLDRD